MRELKLQHLYALFLLLSLGLLAGLAGYAHHNLELVTRQARADEDHAAREEMKLAVQMLDQRLQEIIQRIAAWDETRQHLLDPEYYPLWRDVRVRDTGALPATMRIALYRRDGRIVAPDPDAALPANLAMPETGGMSLRWEAAQPWLYVRFPILLHPDAEVVLGHGLIKLQPLAEIRTLGAYRYADIDNLQLSQPNGTMHHIADLIEHLQVRTQPNPVLTSALEEVSRLTIFAVVLALALALLLFYALRRLLVLPIRQLSKEINALREKAEAQSPAALNTRHHLWELKQLQEAIGDYHRRLLRLHREVEHSSRQFYRQARQDALTGAYNRRAFDEDRVRLERDKRVDECTLILFDCDHFKAINDTYGHPTGDTVIRALAGCLTRALRADDRLYRLGGDEFATLMPDCNIDTAMAVAERCLEQVHRHDFGQYGITEPVTISIGLAHGSAPLDLSVQHKQADLAMYTAKRPGHPKLAVYEDSLGSLSSLVDNREVSAVYEAIRQPDLLEFRYQHIVRFPDLRPEYAEALCRIRYDGQIIGPGAIFAIVQNRRLDVEFDLAVISAIRRDLEADLPALRQGVSINLSAPGVVNDKVIQSLLDLKAAHPERKIVVEITETALITQMTVATANIERLRRAGCLMALDDFGSGYSSLRYLASMPVDMVKFDMSLVRLLEQEDLRQRLVVEDIAQMVATAGYDLVAEGIETETLLARVVDVGFSHGQGFHLDRLLEH